jgi:predicted double-glycine peptidase
MYDWFATAGVLLLVAAAVCVGRWFSRLRKPYWLIGYVLPLLLIVAVETAARIPHVGFIPPFSWLLAGRAGFVILGLAAVVLLTTPLSRLPRRRQKVVVCILMMFFVVHHSVLPFLEPAILRSRLESLATTLDSDGVCIQSRSYTCGPAAAVTALRLVGVAAEEGRLAVSSHTSRTFGTQADLLCEAMRVYCGPTGPTCEYRYYRDLDELDDSGVTVVCVKHSWLVDHFVTVLDVQPDVIVVADPLGGRRDVPRKHFTRTWRHYGIAIRPEKPI